MPSAHVMDKDECTFEHCDTDQPWGLSDEPHALDHALQLLQGGAVHSLADPGITLLSPAQLDRLFLQARRQAERHQENVLLLLDLLEAGRRPGTASDSLLVQRVVHQLHHHYHDQQRWQSLADNAAYYRDHTRVAERIAVWIRANAQ